MSPADASARVDGLTRERSPRLLIVVSQDYGELSNALALTNGTPLDATLLLPDRLYAANRESLPLPAARYADPRDVVAAVERDRPDLVCLFSGYLYAANNLFDLARLENLLGELSSRRIPVVTTDPFLGLMHRAGPAPFSPRHPARQWLEGHFGAVARLLESIPHVYPAPPDPAPSVPWASFFNPAMLLGEADRERCAARAGAVLGVDPARPHWLFVLAQEDYGAQVGRLGRVPFESLLIERLRDVDAAHRRAVLIAPRACVDALVATGRVPGGAVLLPFCSQADFHALLMSAEHAFYWNVFTNSAPARLINQLPVSFLDMGHMAHAMPPLLELGLRSYYPGARMAPLDQRAPLVPEVLATRAAEQDASLAAARERFRAQPAPEAMVADLLRGAR
jgi:hypothetical protein